MFHAAIEQCSRVRGSRRRLAMHVMFAFGLAATAAVGCDDPQPKGPNTARTDAAGGSGGRGGSGGSGGSSSVIGGTSGTGGSTSTTGGTGGTGGATGGTGGTGGATGGTGGTGGATGGTGGATGGTGGATGGTGGVTADMQLPVDLPVDLPADTVPPDTTPAPRCGDGRMDQGEQCDQGAANSAAAYGEGKCTNNCRIAPFCGDSRESNGEQCDRGAQNSDTAYGANACTKACRNGPSCGDRVKQANEECDEGQGGKPATMTAAGCSTQCRILPILTCGDGITTVPEECDRGAQNSDTAGGNQDCTTKCKRPACGDGLKQTDEECDLGAANRDAGTCTRACRNARCGDGLKADTEACDNGAMNVSVAYSPTPPAAGQPRFCRAAGAGAASCTPVPFCGDGTTQTANSEQCDDAADNGKPGKCTAECKTPGPTRKELNVASLSAPDSPLSRACDAATCLADLNSTGGGGVLVSCVADPPTAGGAGFKYKNSTEIEFAPAGGTVEGTADLTLDIDGAAFTLTCFGDGGMPVLMGAGARTIPADCARRSPGIRLRITNNTAATPAPTPPSCLTLRFARVALNVRP